MGRGLWRDWESVKRNSSMETLHDVVGFCCYRRLLLLRRYRTLGVDLRPLFCIAGYLAVLFSESVDLSIYCPSVICALTIGVRSLLH